MIHINDKQINQLNEAQKILNDMSKDLYQAEQKVILMLGENVYLHTYAVASELKEMAHNLRIIIANYNAAKGTK